jgi:ribosomal protein S20
MSTFRLLGVAGALVIAAVIGGTLISAVAAVSPSASAATAAPSGGGAGEYCATYRAALASNLGVSEAALTAAARAAAATTIDKAVTDGDMTKAAGDRLKARLAAAPPDACERLVNRIAKGAKGAKAALGVVRHALAAGADALHMTTAELRGQLKDGTSLKAIAAAKGVDYASLTATITAAVKTDLDAAVAAGTIKQARADRVLERLVTRLADGRLRRTP